MATRTMTNVEEHHGVVDVSPPTGGDAGGEGGRRVLVAFRERCHLMTLTPAGADRAGPKAVSFALLAEGGLPLAPGVVVAGPAPASPWPWTGILAMAGREAGMAEQPAIVASGLGKRFGQLQALTGVDLQVPAGAVVALLGPFFADTATT